MFKFLICFIAGIGAGLGTGFAGMSAAAVISPMLITFLGLPAYEAVGIALARLNSPLPAINLIHGLSGGHNRLYDKFDAQQQRHKDRKTSHSDVLASAVSAYTYGRNKNLDIRNGIVMMVSVLLVTLFGSWAPPPQNRS